MGLRSIEKHVYLRWYGCIQDSGEANGENPYFLITWTTPFAK
jgi:hypothetical protein